VTVIVVTFDRHLLDIQLIHFPWPLVQGMLVGLTLVDTGGGVDSVEGVRPWLMLGMNSS